MELTVHSIVVARDHVDARLGSETVILGKAKGRYYGVQAVGARIWQLIQEPTTLEAVQRTIMAEYDVSSEQAATDLLALIRRMIAEGLVEARDP
jgi:hypothetical protein